MPTTRVERSSAARADGPAPPGTRRRRRRRRPRPAGQRTTSAPTPTLADASRWASKTSVGSLSRARLGPPLASALHRGHGEGGVVPARGRHRPGDRRHQDHHHRGQGGHKAGSPSPDGSGRRRPGQRHQADHQQSPAEPGRGARAAPPPARARSRPGAARRTADAPHRLGQDQGRGEGGQSPTRPGPAAGPPGTRAVAPARMADSRITVARKPGRLKSRIHHSPGR